jgi:hypothetical protein
MKALNHNTVISILLLLLLCYYFHLFLTAGRLLTTYRIYVLYSYRAHGSRCRSIFSCLYPNPSIATQCPTSSIRFHTSGYRSWIQASTLPCLCMLMVVLYQLLSL